VNVEDFISVGDGNPGNMRFIPLRRSISKGLP
jgi:hypothetical protein